MHRAAHEAGAATAIVNIGVTRADALVPLKISARVGEVSFCIAREKQDGELELPNTILWELH